MADENSNLGPAHAEAALRGLEPLRGSELLTSDERKALEIVMDALRAVAAGETLAPWKEGDPMTMRRVRRIEVHYYHPAAPHQVTAS